MENQVVKSNPELSPSRTIWQKLTRDRLAVLGFIIIIIILGLIAAAPIIAKHDPLEINPARKLEKPSQEFLMGTDNLGRSIWARLVWGGRLTLGTAMASMFLISVIGISVGMFTGFSGGWVDDLIMRIVDILMAFPNLILVLAIAGMLGPSLVNVLIGIVSVGWVGYTRVVRGMVLSVKELDYVEAAYAIGTPPVRIATRHILPNIISPIVVLISLDMGNLILSIASLSFLGLGAQAPEPEWGRILSDARPFIQFAPHTMIFPGLAIFVTVMAFNLIGDGVRDILDPHQKK